VDVTGRRPTVKKNNAPVFRRAGFGPMIRSMETTMGTTKVLRLGLMGALFLSTVGAISGCVVRERAVARPERAPCRGGVFIEGHRGPHGRWHPAHWRCPGVVEEVEIE
jgi:hypothetical protein